MSRIGFIAASVILALIVAASTLFIVDQRQIGVVYTLGIVFYVLDARLRHAHGIWHLFVIGGSAVHYFTILFYVL